MRVGGLVAAAVALALGACLLAVPAAQAGKPALQEWPRWPYSVSCGEFAFDPVAVLTGPAGVENGSKPSEQALRGVLEDPALAWMGFRSDWRLAGEDADSAQFISGDPRTRTGLHSISLAVVDGAWGLSGYNSTCQLLSRVYGDLSAVEWHRADDRPLGPNTRRIRVRLGGGQCNGGQPIGDRAHFVFRQLGRRLLMSAWIDPLPTLLASCQGAIEPVLTVRLPGRLGQRELFDGAIYPPRSDFLRQ
jgi:hypothetical protein